MMIRSGAAAGALAAVVAAGACSSGSKPSGIILITLDTTRADRLGCYGYEKGATTNLDAIAREGVRFASAVAAVPTTLASHSTMFTGHYPPVHGVRYNGMFRLGAASLTVAEILRQAGWMTAAIPASYPVNATTGLNQGFDVYRDLFAESAADKLPITAEHRAEDTTRLGLEWLAGTGNRPYFLWLHYYDPHAPYQPPFPYSAQFRDRPYDGEIAYVDAAIGTLLAGLRKANRWDSTLVLIAGDHGEGLFDHGEQYHSNLVYESTLHVPLLAHGPGVAKGKVIGEPVSLADVAPTILDLARVSNPEAMDGVSLRAALRGDEPARRPLYFETLAGSLISGWSPLEGLRRGKWKYIRSSAPELYDLDADPGEESNVLKNEDDLAADLATKLDEDIGNWTKTAKPSEATPVPLDAEALSRLASLGYIGGDVSTSSREGPPPGRLIHLEGDLLQLRDLASARDWAGAKVSATNVLREDPRNRFALQQMAMAEAALRNLPDAERHARKLVDVYPEFVPGVVTLGNILVARGDFRGAAAVFRAGLRHSTDDPALVYPLALALYSQGDVQGALDLARTGGAKKDASPAFRVVEALCHARQGEAAAAVSALKEAVDRGYSDREVLEREPMLAPLRAVPGFSEAIATISAKKS